MNEKRKITILKSILILYFIAGFILLCLNFFTSLSGEIIFSFLAALSINFINFLAALSFFRFSFQKDNKSFLIFNLGGMVLRLFLMLIILIISLNSLKIDQYAFIFTFLLFYFISLFGEIIYFHKKQLNNNPV